jgi:hypothetical protein
MRVRIVRKPPAHYIGIDAGFLAVGRVYNLESSLASALMIDGYAEAYDALSPAEKRERAGEASHIVWMAADHAQRWAVSSNNPSKKKKR